MTFNETFLRTRDKMFFTGYQHMARADILNSSYYTGEEWDQL